LAGVRLISKSSIFEGEKPEINMTRSSAEKPLPKHHNIPRKFLATLAIGTSVMLFAIPATAHSEQKPERIEVAFVLDTTGSMGGLLKGAKKKIWSIANTIIDINPDADVHMALIAYRDFGDAYVTKKFKMSRDIQGLYGNLVQFKAAGGGDTPEAVNEALDASITGLKWSQQSNVRKIVFLVGDAPPHMDYNGRKYSAILKDATQADIIVNTVQAGNSRATRRVWQDIAQRGGGSYIPIPQDGGAVVVIETPYDDEIIILQGKIDSTVLPYGTRLEQSGLFDKLERKAAAAPSVIVDNSAFYAKRKYASEVVTGRGDLIGDLANDRVKLNKIKEKELPEILQGKSAKERQVYVNSKLKARKRLQVKMQALVSKRDKFVAGKTVAKAGSSKNDSFSRAVSRVLEKQLR
jgi:hypothetical protein